MAHGVTTFFLPKLELPVEAFNGHKGVLHRRLHGNPELVLLVAKLKGDPFQDLWELPQDLQRNVLVRSGDLCFGDHSIRADQSEKECGYGEGRKAHFRIGH